MTFRSLQAGLNLLGYDYEYSSNDTVEALKQFENDNHIVVDEIYIDNDENMLISKVLIFVDDTRNDYQYNKLLELVR